jgi:hypothetical protein
MKLKITLCIDPHCPYPECQRNVVARKIHLEKDSELFFDSPRGDGSGICSMLWTQGSSQIIEQIENIMEKK